MTKGKKKLVWFGGAVIIVLAIRAIIWWQGDSTPTNGPSHVSNNQIQTPPHTSFNKHAHSLSDPASIWVVVNKRRPLDPISYVPADLVVPNVPLNGGAGEDRMHLRAQAATALESLFAAASRSGFHLNLLSGYRSYSYQKQLYDGYVKQFGQAGADRQSARPGYSEHQTGWAADVGEVGGSCNLEQCFGTTSAGKWLAQHAYQSGFIIRYTTAKEPITGYEDEPWHIRYIGTALAIAMHKQHALTLEEFFGLGAAPDYQ